MKNIEIKKANIEDLEGIQKLSLKLFEKEKKEYDNLLNLDWSFGKDGTKFFTDCIEEENKILLIVIFREKIIGYLSGGIVTIASWREMPKTAELYNMFVLKEFRNKKIGTKLILEFKNWCEEKNVGKVKVFASSQNTKAIEFYKKYGFKDYSLELEMNL